MPIVRQADFSGGEIDPRLRGKTSDPRYARYVRKLSNMIVVPHGAAMNRPGTQHLGMLTSQTAAPQFMPFLWPSQNYLLEVSAGNIRVWASGVFVVDVAVVGITAGAIGSLKYSQKDADLLITYGGQGADPSPMQPYMLHRVSHAVWTIDVMPVLAASAPVDVIYLSDANGNLVSSPVGIPDSTHPAQPWNWVFTLTIRITSTNEVRESGISMHLTDTTIYVDAARTVPLAVSYDPTFTYAAGHPVVFAGQLWTSIQAGNTGHVPGDVASAAWWVNGIAVYADMPVYFNMQNVVTNALTMVPGAVVLAVNVYRGKHGVYGLVGTFAVGPTGLAQFIDDGADPNYSVQPPEGTNPFATYDATGMPVTFDYPACVTHFQQRRIFARQSGHIGRIMGSKTGKLTNYDVTDIVQDNDALNFDLSSQGIEDIRSLVSMRALIALTSTGATVVRGAGSQRGGSTAVTPTSVDATKQSTRGASWADPILVDNTILYVSVKGSTLRALSYDPFYEVLSNVGPEIGRVGQHLLDGHTIVGMTYQETPFPIVWAWREDGLLLGLTFEPSADPDKMLYGWHKHPIDGAIEGALALPEGREDVVYLAVRRTVNGATVRHLDRFASRVLPQITLPDPTTDDPGAKKTISDVRLGIFLDSALTFDGRNLGATSMQFVPDAGTYLGGEEGVIIAGAAAFVGATDEGDMIAFDPDGGNSGPFTLTILAYVDATHVRAILNAPLPAPFQPGTSNWGWARDTMGGLGHIEGRSVMALADGAVQGPFVVTAGAIGPLSPPAVIVTAGIAYVSDLELLDVAADAVKPNVKNVPRVFLEVVDTRKIWAGEPGAALRPYKPRKAPDTFGNDPMLTEHFEVAISSSWNKGGRVLIRQTDPLPVTVTAVSRDVEVGGK